MPLDSIADLERRIRRLEMELDQYKHKFVAPDRTVKTEPPLAHIDHGTLAGLADDDHAQYLNTTRHDTTDRHTLGTVVPHDDHGLLSGLDDDDHTQYTKHPASSTDNAIARWDGTDGDKLQNSVIKIDDNGKFSGDALDGWIYDTDTWTYVSATSFKIAGKNVAYRFPKGTKIKLVQTTTKYFYVVATAFSTDTTVTITGGSDYTLANATISGQAYSYAAAPQGFPFKDIHIDVVRTTAQSIPDNSWTAISFDTIRSEEKPATSSQWSSGSPTHLTCRLPGRYLIVASVRFAGNATGSRGINIKVNGAWKMAVLVPPPGTLETIISISDIISLQTDDYVEVFVYQDSGAALNANAISDNTGIKWQRIGM